MDLVQHLTVFVLGLVVLGVGAELFIRGAVRVARRLGVSPFVVGLTLVGFGTSAPELVVNISAALRDAPDLATGNIVGSNIANIGLILGLAALARPLTAQMRLLRVELPVVILVSVGLWLQSRDGTLDRVDGLVLLGGFAAMVAYVAATMRTESPEVKKEIGLSIPDVERLWVSVIFLAVGLAGLVGGAELMVRSAVAVAQAWGVSELVIGLTIVAVGTSLPELASSIAAAYKGESDIAVGNVVGSNIFNILLILGLTAQVAPLPVAEPLIRVELPVMIAFTGVLFFVLMNGLSVRRWEGAALLALYAGYIGWQVMRA